MKFRMPGIAALIQEIRARSKRIDDGVIILRPAVLNLSDGDHLVLMTESRLSEHACRTLKEHMERYVATLGLKGAKTLVLEQGMKVQVLRPQAKPSELDHSRAGEPAESKLGSP